ncbi:unnamed protein product [Brassicogethes aeneus]|uniref:Fatty acyl-CoA reductase n=1 Tax=Brassicogethes aeneus TaxID=1431903 RepID=A0A9P0BCG7_BRAAE|nr:unnamed protein product [Brassicogethes aeneus]
MSKTNSQSVRENFSNAVFFITGATGYIGKLTLEDILRNLDVKKVYILVRGKRGFSSEERLKRLLQNPLFERVLLKNPECSRKIHLLEGDLLKENLGLSSVDISKIQNEVEYFIHCAATVKFDEKLHIATQLNVKATKDLTEIAKKAKKIKALVHISTAYSNSPIINVEEKVYTPCISPDSLLKIVQNEVPDYKEKSIIGEWPNTYSFTKNIAEAVIQEAAKNIPVCIVRPSIVISTIEDPIPGFIDNKYGAVSGYLAISLGFIRTLHVNNYDVKLDMVPADFVANSILAAAWNTAIQPKSDDATVYNCVNNHDNYLTLRHCVEGTILENSKCPTSKQFWYPFLLPVKSRNLYLFLDFLLHHIPYYTVDYILYFLGKETITYKAMEPIRNMFPYFLNREWNFENKNFRNLHQKLSVTEKRIFNFNMGSINWDDYAYYFHRGAKQYLLKDTEPLENSRKRFKLLKILHFGVIGIMIMFLLFGILFTLHKCF